jgi:hypothetical protein
MLRQDLGLGALAAHFRDREQGRQDSNQQRYPLVGTVDMAVSTRHELLPVSLIDIMSAAAVVAEAFSK